MKLLNIFVSIFVLCLLTAVPGCSTVDKNPATAQLVTQYAVAKYLEQRGDQVTRYASAQRIDRIAERIKSTLSTTETQVSLDALHTVLNKEIFALELSRADAVLANGLVNVLLSEFETRFKTTSNPLLPLNPEQVVAAGQVLEWIQAVTSTIPPPPSVPVPVPVIQ